MADARKKAMLAGHPFGQTKNGVAIGKELALQYAEDMMQAILVKLPESLRNSPEHRITRNSFNEPTIKVEGDKFRISISFRKGAVHRDSLEPNATAWNKGIENIVVHLSNGWAARGTVFGVWHGHTQESRMEYAGDDFMKKAVADFNRTHALAKAELGDSYYG